MESLFYLSKVHIKLLFYVYVSFYLHFSEYIDSDQLCYIYIASFTSPARPIPRE